jgi:hypothetical protein
VPSRHDRSIVRSYCDHAAAREEPLVATPNGSETETREAASELLQYGEGVCFRPCHLILQRSERAEP